MHRCLRCDAMRWRWNANISLAVVRNHNGKRVPAQFQRADAEDLVAVIFPDHPLVKQWRN